MKKSDLCSRAYDALLAGAMKVAPSIKYDRRYTSSWAENLAPGLPLTEIENDFRSGAGRELDRKFCAAHSSAALVVNCFGAWRLLPKSLTIRGITGFESMRFEKICGIWAGRTPPHLDMFAEGEVIVAVESKCTEWMQLKSPEFSESYERLQRHNHDPDWEPWLAQMCEAQGKTKFFDSAQIVKHAFGLLTCFPERSVILAYLFWEPRNATDIPECRLHREQAHEFADKVKHSSVRLMPMSYRELWKEWEISDPPAHLRYLFDRYDAEISPE